MPAAVIWLPARRGMRPWFVRSVLPICALFVIALITLIFARRYALIALGIAVLSLPVLLQGAEEAFERQRPRPLKLDLHGISVGRLSISWRAVDAVEVGSIRGGGQVVKVKLDRDRVERPRRSMLWRLGLYPGDRHFDFCIGADYGLPAEMMAVIVNRLRTLSA